MIKLGAREIPLRPAYQVLDAFEDLHGGIVGHLEGLSNGTATMKARARLIYEGARAADPSTQVEIEAIKERLFDAGLWSEGVVMKEVEFVEKLIYTPEQYQAKKEERAEAMKAMEEHLQSFSGDFSD